ncbi:MAG: 50S ribosomal protein L11 methyltransferase, partial [Caldisphaera sp.]|nr:50S ribosomal protein L11 methyltransferase [Caldisphaera sp.]
MDSAQCISINKTDGQKAINILKEENLLLSNLKPKTSDRYIFLPVNNSERAKIILDQKSIFAQICNESFDEYKYKIKRLNKEVPGISSYMIIGDIAIINYNNNMDLLKKAAVKISYMNPKIKSVYAKINTGGEYRTPRLVLLYGEEKTYTLYRENGIRFYVDVLKAYINPRLSNEHYRIANLINDNEDILDMFTGIGGFALNIAKLKKSNIVAVDLNPYAISLASLNYSINKKILRGIVNFLRADSLHLNYIIKARFDKIIMNNPTKSLEFLEAACKLAKNEATIYLYLLDYNDSNLIS